MSPVTLALVHLESRNSVSFAPSLGHIDNSETAGTGVLKATILHDTGRRDHVNRNIIMSSEMLRKLIVSYSWIMFRNYSLHVFLGILSLSLCAIYRI